MKQVVPILVAGDDDRTNCPTCGMAVRVARRTYGEADHYEAVIDGEGVGQLLAPVDPETSAKLKRLRKGKKTVAIVGMAPTSCSLAPFDDPDVEIWGLNESHAFPWMTRWDRWFQIHQTESWKRYIAKRDVRGHFDWLTKEYPADRSATVTRPKYRFWKNLQLRWELDSRSTLPAWRQRYNNFFHGVTPKEHTAQQVEKNLKPIYMQYWHPQVPNSVGYPLYEVTQDAFANFRKGDEKVKYFTSTFAYMMGIALLEKFDRIEVYGFEMADDIEYVQQKACAEFWIGLAMGRGIEVYVPPNNQILHSDLYGGNEQGAGW